MFVFLCGTNLTDEDARQHASPLKDIVQCVPPDFLGIGKLARHKQSD